MLNYTDYCFVDNKISEILTTKDFFSYFAIYNEIFYNKYIIYLYYKWMII